MSWKTVAALVVGLLTWALSDILLWQRIFETHGLDQFDALYQRGHLAVLAGLLLLGVVLLIDRPAWAAWYAFALCTLAYGGLADVLYYWLDGRAVPATLPWLDAYHPLIVLKPVTAASLALSSALWLCWWAGVAWAMGRQAHARRPG